MQNELGEAYYIFSKAGQSLKIKKTINNGYPKPTYILCMHIIMYLLMYECICTCTYTYLCILINNYACIVYTCNTQFCGQLFLITLDQDRPAECIIYTCI